MNLYLITHYFRNPMHQDAFTLYREKRLSLVQKHNGTVLSAFQPSAGGENAAPDEIHVIEFASEEVYEAYRSDPAQAGLASLQEQAILQAVEYRSEVIIPQESVFATVLSKRPEALKKEPDPTVLLKEKLTQLIPPLSPQDFHPAQKQVELDTVILHPENETQKKLSRFVQKWQADKDRRVIFAHTYYLMTGNMLSALRGGEFHDRKWVSALLDRFAVYYFSALSKYEHAPISAPPVWRIAFQVAENENSYTVQHLLLGVNAHINFDLVATLIDLLKDEWKTLTMQQKRQRYEDHTHVNEIIGKTFDETQELVIARYSPVLDRLTQYSFNLDNLIISSLIASWREQAWQHAVAYLDAGHRDIRHSVLQETEYIALRRADMIMLRQGPVKMQVLF